MRPFVVTKINGASYPMNDEAPIYVRMVKEFNSHGRVNHGAAEYVITGGFKHTNTVENFFSIFKHAGDRNVPLPEQAAPTSLLRRVLFRYDTRKVPDDVCTDVATKCARGKRLTYRRFAEAA